MTDKTTKPKANIKFHMPRDLRDRLRWLAANATVAKRKRVTMVDMITGWVARGEREQELAKDDLGSGPTYKESEQE